MLKLLALALALVLSSAGVAAAGGGGVGAGITITLFDCYVIHNGPDSPFTLTVSDQFGVREHVRLGKARLLCTPTTPNLDADGTVGAIVERGPALNGNFDPFAADHLKCYDVNPSLAGPVATVRVTDPFADETVSLEKLSVLCAPAIKEVVGP
jgi:hypothetical protein